MRERLRLYDGQLELHSAPGEGTRLRAVVPLLSA
jgi:signal transduction histidine kinase